MCTKLSSLSSTSYPHLFLHPCGASEYTKSTAVDHHQVYNVPLFFEQSKYFHLLTFPRCDSSVPVLHYLPILSRSLSRSVQPHESSYCFHVFPVCLNMSPLYLHMPLLPILQDSVYMVILEPCGCFNLRSRVLSLNPHGIFILPLIDRITCLHVFSSPLAQYLTHSVYSVE